MINPFDRPITYAPKIEDILYWVAERENIRQMKEAGEPREMWTADPILQKYRFCNVRRRDDRMTKWMCDNLFTPYTLNDDRDMWFVSAIARYVNWPPTLLSLLVNGAIPGRVEEFDPDCFVGVMDDLKKQGLKCWGSAYLIYPSKDRGVSKAETVAYRFLLPLTAEASLIRDALKQNSIEAFVTTLSKFWGWSTFMAGQVASDLSYYPQELGNAVDLFSWAPIGPGSSLGLNMLLGRNDNAHWKQDEFNRELIKVWNEVEEQLELDNFTLHDQQNVFCEMSKYWKVLRGTGKPKNTYTTETAY